jgi:prolyl-tRNA synthetase
MRYSRILIPTIKEVPADAEIISHQLLLRAGMMRKIASGTYTYLLLGWRSLLKIINIVREEMNAAGAQEILMPSLQPMELWQQTGRDVDYGETMCHLTDRHGRENVLAPTAEEVVTFLAAGEISSYKQLPFNLYQISPKFRDEFRPRFGPIRSREFIMKDAYSFHDSPESLEETYRAMYNAYCKIFSRCGLEYVIVEAETGEMGGSGSHQFTIPCESGEDTIVYTEDGSYAANIERASVDALPKNEGRGTNDDERKVPPIEEVHTPNVGSIEAVCAFLKTKPEQMIKTLIYSKESKTIAALVRGDHEVNDEKFKIAAGSGKLELADESTIEKTTDAKVGFAGPVGLSENVDKIIIDHAVAAMAVGVTGANKTDYHIKNVVPGRDFPLQGDNIVVADIRNACEGDTYNGKKLLFKKGIEVGQVFKLGTKYSEKLNAKYLDENNVEKACLMGCYGIGINRILASAIELNNDKDGIIWSINIAPFEVIITCTNQDDPEVAKAAEDIYNKLQKNKIDVLLDDRILRAGAKFKDADLIGIPIRITVGKKSIAEGNIEIKLRRESENEKVKIENVPVRVTELINKLRS